MNLEIIRQEVEQLLQLIDGWERSEEKPLLIERDIALNKISRLYELLRFSKTDFDTQQQETEPSQDEESNEVVEVDDSIFAIDLDEVILSSVDDTTETEEVITIDEEPQETESATEEEPTPLVEDKPEVEVEPTPQPETEVEQERPRQPVDNVLFDIDITPPKHSRRRRNALMSLYTSEQINRQEAQPTKEIDETPKAEEKPVHQEEKEIKPESIGDTTLPLLGDSIAPVVETIADRLSTEQVILKTISDSVRYTAFNQLGINEQYQIAFNLFDDDAQRARMELAKLDSFESYDDAMIYIAENFNWSDESPSVGFILSVLENKFLN